MPKTGDPCDSKGTYVDEHGHEVAVKDGETFPPCPDGETWWWHADLPVAVHMKWQAARRAERRQGKRER